MRSLRFWVPLAALLATMAMLALSSARQESQTFDEGLHLTAGYRYWKLGDLAYSLDQPPLPRALCAIPLLFLKPGLPPMKPDPYDYAVEFLYTNRVPAESMLFAARAVSVAGTLVLALVLALWTRGKFGARAALLAAALFALDPNFIAHGHYVAHDVAAAATFFFACLAWGAWLESARWRWALAAGVLAGIALCSKHSAILLGPMFLVLAAARLWQRRGPSAANLGISLGIATLLACGVVAVVYSPSGLQPPAAHPFITGLRIVLEHAAEGHSAYLFGRVSERGWWYYFPAAFVLKTPLTVLILLVCAAAVLVRSRGRLRKLRSVPFHWFVLTLPPLIYFAASMPAHINIGLRHILPVYPFLFAFLAALLASRLKTWTWAALFTLLIFETGRIHPHYLAFFNVAAGGPERGPRYLVDSNLDWGQDMLNLRRYLDARGHPSVCLCYFGRAAPWYYKIGETPLHPPEAGEVDPARLDCSLAAISVTPLYGVYVNADAFRRFREREPLARIGYSIYIYDLKRR